MLNRSKSGLVQTLLVTIFSVYLLAACGGPSSPSLVTPFPPSSAGGAAPGPASDNNGYNSVSSDVELGFGEFSMATADTHRPSEIREYVDFFAGGGAPSCEDKGTRPYMSWSQDTYEIVPTNTGWSSEDILLGSCGWSSPGSLLVTIDYPDGTSRTISANVVEDRDGGLAVYLKLELEPDPPYGTYAVHYKGHSATLTHVFNLRFPTEPRLFSLPGSVVLWNFQAYEPVAIVAFEEVELDPIRRQGKFMAYKEFVTDGNGQLQVSTFGGFDAFVAIGAYTGQVSEFSFFNNHVMDVFVP